MFVALYEKGYIYRDRYMVNWDPGQPLGDLRPRGRGPRGHRHALLHRLPARLGQRARSRSPRCGPRRCSPTPRSPSIPDDERYRRLIGETAILPLVGRRLKIIADEYVKPEFGTGALKITPGHDPNDFEIGHRHGLRARSRVIGEDGRITDDGAGAVRGHDDRRGPATRSSRSCDEQGLIATTEEYTHTVPFSQRSGERIEPLISLQWFMRMDELAAPAIEVGHERRRSGSTRSAGPASTSTGWRTSGPGASRASCGGATRSPSGTAARTRPTSARAAPEGEGWERDPDVLDTWFSSALWPFATLGWPEQTPRAARLLSRPTCSSPAATSSSCGSRG